MINLPQLLTIKEAAATIGVRPGSLHTEIRRGRLPYRVVGGTKYVTESDLNEMLSACHVQSDRPASGSANQADHMDGSSSTTAASTAQVAAQETVRVLREHLRGTSRQSISRPARPN
jgi:hypothetical protein